MCTALLNFSIAMGFLQHRAYNLNRKDLSTLGKPSSTVGKSQWSASLVLLIIVNADNNLENSDCSEVRLLGLIDCWWRECPSLHIVSGPSISNGKQCRVTTLMQVATTSRLPRCRLPAVQQRPQQDRLLPQKEHHHKGKSAHEVEYGSF